MAFLNKAKKEDLHMLATEMGESVEENTEVVNLKKLILNSEEYEETAVKEMLENIVSARLELVEERERERREEQEERKRREEREERKRHDEIRVKEIESEERKRRDELRMEEIKLEQKRLEIAANGNGRREERSSIPRLDIQKLVPSFDVKNNDISLFLSLFERQAKVMKIPDEFWVAQLISVLPSDVVSLIAREPEEETSSYEYVKKMLLKRFKLGPENFRQKFMKHQKKPENTWRDFYYELKKFCEEWLERLEITNFDQLKDLMIVDQIKRRAPADVHEHFLDIWSTIVSPTQLTEKLDDYEEIRQNF